MIEKWMIYSRQTAIYPFEVLSYPHYIIAITRKYISTGIQVGVMLIESALQAGQRNVSEKVRVVLVNETMALRGEKLTSA